MKVKILKDVLQGALPQGFKGKIRYLYTPSKLCDPLFSPLPGKEPEKTRLASHFLIVSGPVEPSGYDNVDKPKWLYSDVIILGIEVLIYKSSHLTTIFVSKADSTGFGSEHHPKVSARAIATSFLKWLLDREQQKYPQRDVVLSLFARSQSQYLFPGSADSGVKHILDDRQLIKWWVTVLDPILIEKKDASGGNPIEFQGYLTVPGFTGSELRQFYPTYSRAAGGNQSWLPGNPLHKLADIRCVPANSPTRCLLPRFPDDPKARLMQDLDDEVGLTDGIPSTSPIKRRNGQWSSIHNLDHFWEAMEFRQECSSGRMVGFLWILASPQKRSGKRIDDGPIDESHEFPSVSSSSQNLEKRDDTPTPTTSKTPTKPKRKRLTGPIIPRKPRLKGGLPSMMSPTNKSKGILNPTESGNGLLLSKEGYDKAMQILLHLDFSNVKLAEQSTGKWVAEVSSICGLSSDWAEHVEGIMKTVKCAVASDVVSGGCDVNDIGGIVRKRKHQADQPLSGTQAVSGTEKKPTVSAAPAVNMLSAGMIRKKPKPSPA